MQYLGCAAWRGILFPSTLAHYRRKRPPSTCRGLVWEIIDLGSQTPVHRRCVTQPDLHAAGRDGRQHWFKSPAASCGGRIVRVIFYSVFLRVFQTSQPRSQIRSRVTVVCAEVRHVFVVYSYRLSKMSDSASVLSSSVIGNGVKALSRVG